MLHIRQIEGLYRQSYFSYTATMFGAVLAFWLFFDISNSTVLYTWFAIFTAFTIFRTGITWCFNRRDKQKDIEIWLNIFLVTSAISGTLWGLTGFLFIPEHALPILDSVLYHGILLLFVATLIAGSIITYSASKLVFLSFAVPAVIPQCLMLIAKGDKYHSFLGGVMLAYALIMYVLSLYIHRVFANYCIMENQKEHLEAVLKKNGIKID